MLTLLNAFVGIDVAFAKMKQLPVVVTVINDGRLEPLPLRTLIDRPPRGRGNALALEPEVVEAFAEETVEYLRAIERESAIRIQRVAIDAPSGPAVNGLQRRLAECALDERGISCIPTPTAKAFEGIQRKARAHLAAGRSVSTIPHANQLWMLVGFELFRRLGREWECLEVYPQATVRLLDSRAPHKSQPGEVARQLTLASLHTGWLGSNPKNPLGLIAFGGADDKCDAYLATWVASLPEADRVAMGNPPDDVIWVPRLPTFTESH